MAGHQSLDPTSMPNCTGEVGVPAGKSNKEFTHRIKLVPVNDEAVILKGIPWAVHFEDAS